MNVLDISNIDINGDILLIDKPLRWTSFDVVNKLKCLVRQTFNLKKIKIGHAGTLDPLATGLLIVCVGKCTKQIPEIQTLQKKYTGTFTIGATTASFDLEKPIENPQPYEHITPQDIQNAKRLLTGEIEQIPPVFSALKINGQKAYTKARQDEDVQLSARKVNVFQFDTPRIALPEVDFEITCSKGTYIRSMARDFGPILGCGAYLSTLRRVAIGDYTIDKAFDFSPFVDINRTHKGKKKDFEL